MTYAWSDREKADMKPGTPLILRRDLRHDEIALYLGSSGHMVSVGLGHGAYCGGWEELRPCSMGHAHLLGAQERELLDTRSLDLARTRKALEDERAKHGDYVRAMSHLIHANQELEAKIAHPLRVVHSDGTVEQLSDGRASIAAERDDLLRKVEALESELVVWKANDSQARRDWNADKECAGSIVLVLSEFSEFHTPQEMAEDVAKQLRYARAQLEARSDAAERVVKLREGIADALTLNSRHLRDRLQELLYETEAP